MLTDAVVPGVLLFVRFRLAFLSLHFVDTLTCKIALLDVVLKIEGLYGYAGFVEHMLLLALYSKFPDSLTQAQLEFLVHVRLSL